MEMIQYWAIPAKTTRSVLAGARVSLVVPWSPFNHAYKNLVVEATLLEIVQVTSVRVSSFVRLSLRNRHNAVTLKVHVSPSTVSLVFINVCQLIDAMQCLQIRAARGANQEITIARATAEVVAKTRTAEHIPVNVIWVGQGPSATL
jgi:hypothetical protein